MQKTDLKREAKISARIPKQLKEKMEKLNNAKNYKYMSESNIICMAIEEYVEKYGEGSKVKA
jgi:Arc/MetJ-type ribon-helix-helix transcriptional regulator